MTTHYPAVPVTLAHEAANRGDPDRVPPLILVVDDEPLIADTLAAILRENGLATMTAPDGPTALELAELIPPQLLLCDLVLPGMDGFTLAKEIEHKIPDCEVILYSCQPSISLMAGRVHAEGRDVLMLTEPVHPTDMLARVFDRLSLHGWDAPEGFTLKPPG